MKKIVLLAIAFIVVLSAGAQDKQDNKQDKKDQTKKKIDRANDHFMLQISSDHWTAVPDSIKSHMTGFSRGLNFYLMLDKRFKGSPRWSAALGLGVSSSSMFFKKMDVDLNATGTSVLPFVNLDSADHFKKYKLVNTYLEIPVELRYAFNPKEDNKSWKIAMGIKVGTMVSPHTKGKNLQDKYDQTINSYTQKEYSKRFFNSTRIAATARVGYGHYSLFGAYQLNTFLKDGAGAPIRPYQIGITFSGL